MEEKHEYPKYIWHRDEGQKIVHSQDEHEALGEGWQEHPSFEDEGEGETEQSEEATPRAKKQASTPRAKKQVGE